MCGSVNGRLETADSGGHSITIMDIFRANPYSILLREEGIIRTMVGSNLIGQETQGWMAFMMAVVEDDGDRASRDLSQTQSYVQDYILSANMNYDTGVAADGSNYSFGMTFAGSHRAAWTLSHNVAGFPSLDTSGPWVQGLSLYWMYSMRPDRTYARSPAWCANVSRPLYFGTQAMTLFAAGGSADNSGKCVKGTIKSRSSVQSELHSIQVFEKLVELYGLV